MPPSHWSFGPQGGGSGRTLVRPACAYAEDHDDCVLVTRDLPGHVTTLTDVMPFHVLSKFFRVYKLCWGRPMFSSVWRALAFTSNMSKLLSF